MNSYYGIKHQHDFHHPVNIDYQSKDIVMNLILLIIHKTI